MTLTDVTPAVTIPRLDAASLTPEPVAAAASSTGASGRMVGIVAMAGSFPAMLDTTVVSVSLHATSERSGETACVQWVPTTYMLALCATMTGSSWLVGRFGSGRVYATALAGFAVASMACTLAPTLGALIAARSLAGAAADVLTPVSTVLLTDGVPCDRLGMAQSLQGSVMMIGPLVGPTVRGVLVGAGGWPPVYVMMCTVLLTRGAGVSLAVFPAMTRVYKAIPAAIAHAALQLNLPQRIVGTMATAIVIMTLKQGAHARQGLTSPVFADASVWVLAATAFTCVPAALLLVAECRGTREGGDRAC